MAQREGGRVFGFPLKGFGFFTSLLLAFAAAFFTVFRTTTVAIFALLAWKCAGPPHGELCRQYKYVGFSRGVVVGGGATGVVVTVD